MNSPITKPVTLRAHYDGKNTDPDEPCDLPIGTPLIVMAGRQDELALEAERREWAELSLQNLARAYGPDEPEYDRSMIIELNPNFRER